MILDKLFQLMSEKQASDLFISAGIPIHIKIQGNTAQFDGVFTLKRNDFAIGEGIWSDTSAVANEVPVKFHIITTSSK